jgi:CHASE2 domain-containing sensor protein
MHLLEEGICFMLWTPLMQKGLSFWKKDWVAGLVIIIGLFFVWATTELIDNIENYAYDLGVQASSKAPGDKVAIIAIDDQSIANLGRWPWPRTTLATMIGSLQQGGAKAIGLPLFLSEAQIDPGLASIRDISTFYTNNLLMLAEDTPAVAELGTKLSAAEATLNTDQHLADAMGKAGNVVLSMQFQLGEMQGNPDKPLPEFVTRNQIVAVRDRMGAVENYLTPPEANEAVPPHFSIG